MKDGITLIALIITIIVMLILVAVTVTVAKDGGLFTTARQAKVDTAYKAEEETLLTYKYGEDYDAATGELNLEEVKLKLEADTDKWVNLSLNEDKTELAVMGVQSGKKHTILSNKTVKPISIAGIYREQLAFNDDLKLELKEDNTVEGGFLDGLCTGTYSYDETEQKIKLNLDYYLDFEDGKNNSRKLECELNYFDLINKDGERVNSILELVSGEEDEKYALIFSKNGLNGLNPLNNYTYANGNTKIIFTTKTEDNLTYGYFYMEDENGPISNGGANYGEYFCYGKTIIMNECKNSIEEDYSKITHQGVVYELVK